LTQVKGVGLTTSLSNKIYPKTNISKKFERKILIELSIFLRMPGKSNATNIHYQINTNKNIMLLFKIFISN
jgi:hypothetical protein